MKQDILERIPINIKNQHRLLNLLAEGYKSLSKALMEYIDNAFDSADDFYDEKDKKYKRNVTIDICINRKNNIISIKDNCEGMTKQILAGLANSINDSEKRRREQKRPWVNGQFGLGAHAYRFFAQELRVTTRKIGYNLFAISIDRDSPDANLIKPAEVEFSQSGTFVELCGIEKIQMKHLNSQELKREIETYFEMLLNRNVTIKIIDEEIEYICEPFNYDTLTGEEIKKVINKWCEGTAFVDVQPEGGIMVNLKVCTDIIKRPPFFSRKGRRINFISDLDSFIRKTEHRKKVWESYYLTGFIEVQDNLEPVMTRDDFLGGKGHQQRRTGIYEEIVKLEDEIYTAIEAANKDKNDESLKNLASKLTDILSELAKEEEVKLKYQNDGNPTANKEKVKIELNPDADDEFTIITSGAGKRGKKGKIIKGDENPTGLADARKIEKQKSGIKIVFSTLPSPARSHYGDGVITIFTSHPNFEERKGITHRAELGAMKITARLANYLAAVISSEFKEIFYQQKKLEPDRKLVLDEQIDFIFKFEEKIKDFIDQPLSSLGEQLKQ